MSSTVSRHVRDAAEVTEAQLRQRGWRRWLERVEGTFGMWLARAIARLLAKC